MSDIKKDFVHIALQFLNEENYKEAMHKLEKESGLFFNFRYFKECIMKGEFEEAENYLSGFTKIGDNQYSTKTFYGIRRQKYLEALDSHDMDKAVEILRKDLTVFSGYNGDIVQSLADLLALPNFRQNEQLSNYSDAETVRANLVVDLEKAIDSNPLFRGKLEFPSLQSSRLRSLIAQSVQWQHRLCQNPRPNPTAETLFVDHSCDQPNTALTPSPVVTAPPNYRPVVGGFQLFDPRGLASSSANTSLGGLIGGAVPSSSASMLNQPGHPTTNNPGLGFVAYSEHVVKRPKPIRISNTNGARQSLPVVISEIPSNLVESKIWKFTEINEPAQLRSSKLPDSALYVRIMKLAFTFAGGAVLALAENGVHKHWKWPRNDQNPAGKAITTVPPKLLRSSNGILMINDVCGANLKEAVPCFALSKNGSYAVSASGGKISLFNLVTLKTMETFMTNSPAATSLAFHPEDNNIVAIGMEDSSIQIYNIRLEEVISKLKGHQSKVTGLAFSEVLNVLVSSGSDGQLCVWNTKEWKKKGSKSLSIPSGREQNPSAKTRVQFHNDQTHMLVVHETLLAIYDASKLERIHQWGVPIQSCGVVTDATYSSDSQSIYASFQDGSICVLTASPIRLRCKIYSTSYVPSNISSGVHALAIAANPEKPNQFAVGLTDGGVLVIEPLESEEQWGTAPPNESGQSSSGGARQNQS